jgi:signal transduction histidine kinase
LRKQFLQLIVLTIATVFLVAWGWEFFLEKPIQEFLFNQVEIENYEEKWEFVWTSVIFSFIALILPTILNLRNIKRREQLEEKLQVHAVKLERANRELEDFAAIASHDLQEPLRKIIVFGDLLQETTPDLHERSQVYLERMQNAAQRMQQLIRDLLLFSRVTTQRKPFEVVNFREIVEQVIEDLDMRISQAKGMVTIEDLPVLEADAFQIHQLFQNLIGNALKYHREGVSPRVTITSQLNGNGTWEIKLVDNGIGFDEKFIDRIFKPFERLHGRSKYDGTGMGLAICQKIVRHHGGEINVKSWPEKGTTFFIIMPARQKEKVIP